MRLARRDQLSTYFRKHRDVIRAALTLAVLAAGPIVFCELWLFQLRSPEETAASHQRTNDQTAAVSVPTISAATFDRLAARLDKQKAQRSEWAYAALVAIVAVSVLKRVSGIPWIRPAYVLMGVAGAFLFESLRAADEYERSVAFLMLEDTVTSPAFDTVNAYLRLQMYWFNTAAFLLLLFVGAFLTAVLVQPPKQEATK